MMSLMLFQSQTDYDSDSNAGAIVRGFLKRNRGGNIGVIDAALTAYERDLITQDAGRIGKALENVYITCQWWLRLKKDKIGVKTETTNTDTRAQVIQTLKNEAIQELTQNNPARAAFATNKASAVSLGTVAMKKEKGSLTKASEMTGTVDLAKGYEHERKTYTDSDKTQAVSASTIYNRPNTSHDISYRQYKKAYDTMVKEGAVDLTVAYLPKADRLDYLLVCQNGIFMYPNGAKAKNSIASNQGEPYAIDRYGNFFSTQLGTTTPRGQVFNHSCFTAGTPVMCAGTCQFDAGGRLHHIDNDSGHYKPDRNALHKAVNLVISQGVSGAELRVGLKAANGTSYFKGTTFAANINAANADWDPNDNAGFGLV